jgi:hypothetical protein
MKKIEIDIPRIHRQQLAETGVVAYRLIEALEQTAITGGWSGTFVRNGILLSETLIALRIPVGDEAIKSISLLKTLQPNEAEKSWACLANLVSSLRPSRSLIKFIITNFGSWLDKARGEKIDSIADFLTGSHDLLSTISFKDTDQLINEILKMPPPKSKDFAIFIKQYTRCSRPAALAIQQFAKRAIDWDSQNYLNQLLIVLPPGRVSSEVDSENFIRGLASMSEACAGLPNKEVWGTAVDLSLRIGMLSLSTGYYASRSLAGALRKLDNNAGPSYLNSFSRLFEKLGVGIAGFSIHELPKLYAKHGTEKTERFVTLACDVFEISGSHAAVWFLERRSTISRQALPV